MHRHQGGAGHHRRGADPGLPILLSGFIPGQEEGNVPFVVDNRVGVLAETPQAIARQVQAWFGPARAEMAQMAENARRLGNPRSTHQIVAELASLITEPDGRRQ
ncbi:MAG TPA: hypothetical protein VNK95_01295 [Caldilineaceae bacterium]|nr:hypothetical protein [Caldilineaceae bacterium]